MRVGPVAVSTDELILLGKRVSIGGQVGLSIADLAKLSSGGHELGRSSGLGTADRSGLRSRDTRPLTQANVSSLPVEYHPLAGRRHRPHGPLSSGVKKAPPTLYWDNGRTPGKNAVRERARKASGHLLSRGGCRFHHCCH